LCQELRDAYAESQTIQYGPWAGVDYGPSSLLDRADAALATPPAVGATTAPVVEPADMKEREALATWLERHYEYANEVNRPDWARMSIRAASLLRQATPPAATREAVEPTTATEVRLARDWYLKGCDDTIKSVQDLLKRQSGPPIVIAPPAHAPAATTREAGPLPQAGLTDEQLLELMPQQFRDDLATVSRLASYGTPVGPGLYRVSLNTGALAFARAVWDRAVLARWGGAAVPVAVSERPWERPGWCDAEGRCWCFTVGRNWRSGYSADRAWMLRHPEPDVYDTHLLPHWALPVPAAANREQP
jgi:hypothetical protein